MTEKLPKLVTVAFDDDMCIVMKHMCNDLHMEPSVAINRLCIAAVCCAVNRSTGAPNPCNDLLDAAYQALIESVDELHDQKQRREYYTMLQRLKEFEG